MTTRPAATLLFFWDYDTQWGADRSRSPGGPKTWGHLEFQHTERLLELHADYDVPACFAVVGAAAQAGARPYADAAQVRAIHAAGHEIASHALHHEWLPALDSGALHQTLQRSKHTLEQCIGAAVVSFVPPFNQPFDCAARWSWSRSERRAVPPHQRTNLGRLCTALRTTGYRFSRVSYRSIGVRFADWVLQRSLEWPTRVETINGLACVRLNTPGGFGPATMQVVEQAVCRGGIVAVYGHPHSLHAGNSQDEHHLVPFLEWITQLRRAGRLRICQPRMLVAANEYH